MRLIVRVCLFEILTPPSVLHQLMRPHVCRSYDECTPDAQGSSCRLAQFVVRRRAFQRACTQYGPGVCSLGLWWCLATSRLQCRLTPRRGEEAEQCGWGESVA